MTQVMKRYGKGVVLKPETADVTENAEGSLWSNSTEQRMKTYIEGAVRQLVTNNQTQTLENKTIVAANNTITTAASGNLAATELNAALAELQGDIDTRATSIALNDHINDVVDAHDASAISNVPSGNLAATDVQAALNELQGDIDTNASGLSNHLSDTTDAHDASAISVVPTGNLAASDVQAALNELQGDADSAATHIAASTNVHGIGVGNAVVGTGTSQTLTNKTITGASIQTPFRSDVKQDTKANLVTYATTATNGQLVFATDTKELLQVLDGVLSAAGGGGIGGVDILFVQDFEAAALSDFTQTGLSLSTSSPLHGDVSALLTHQNAVNQSFKQVIAVDRKFRGEAMTMRLNVKSNATAGNVTLNVYDETNSANLVASEQLQLANDTSGALNKIAFTIPETCASLSYTVTALPEAGSPVTRVDDIIAELAVTSLLETSVEVPVITSWQDYTPTFQGFGTPSAVQFEWRQVGEDVEIRGKFTSGTATAVEARIGLPGGLISAGTGIIPSIQIAGSLIAYSTTAAAVRSVLIEPSVAYLTVGEQSAGLAMLTKRDGNGVASSGSQFNFTAKVPCAGLSATTTKTIDLTQSGLIQNSDSSLIFSGNAGQVITADVTNVPFANLVSSVGSDIGSWNGSQLTVASNGILSISCEVGVTAVASRAVVLYVNGSYFQTIGDYANVGAYNGSYTGYFSAGDVISIRINGTNPTLLNSTTHKIIFSKSSALKQVSVSSDQKIKIPTSELRFEGASTRGSTATAIVKFDTLAKLRGDAFSIVNDATNGTVITMRKAGKLDISASLDAAGTLNQLAISRNQSVLTALPSASETLSLDYGDVASVSWQGSVAVGDVIRASTVTTNPSASSANNFNLFFQEQDIAVSVTNTLPQFSESDSSVRVTGTNGYGSTGTRIRRFSNIEQNIGTDIEYIDSATNGASFTVKSNGVYSVSFTNYTNQSTIATYSGISKNASSLTTDITSLIASETLAISGDIVNSASATPRLQNASWTGYLLAGDIIRAHSDSSTGTSVNASFNIAKVGKPNVTGVNVTPFVNIPQNDVENMYYFNVGSFSGGATITGALTSSTNKGILSYNSSTGIYTALKRCTINTSVSARSSSATSAAVQIVKNTSTIIARSNSINAATYFTSASGEFSLEAGETFYCNLPDGGVTGGTYVNVTATAASDSIITASESFSTDTASLQYASSAAYTLSTLQNAPVGTFITFTSAGGSNTITQTTTAPTQTTSDMNVNGIATRLQVTANATTAANPSYYSMQIGKGQKGVRVSAFKNTGKSVGIVTDASTGVTATGVPFVYNEQTGIITINTGRILFGTVTTWAANAEDGTAISHPSDLYVVINASKSPALVGVPLLQPRIATISDVKVSGSNGGASIATTQTRTLNTLVDPTGIVTSLASNQFTLASGTYYIEASAPAFGSNGHKIRLRNITDSSTSLIGSSAFNAGASSVQTLSTLAGEITIASAKVFELQHTIQTARATDGLGTNTSSGESEVYSIVKITKVK
jgi:hypothetical protein